MILGLDLDNTVFNAEPIYKMGFKYFHQYKYTPPSVWHIYECYPKEVADKILEYFQTKPGFDTKPFYIKYSQLLKEWQQKYHVKIITSRSTNCPDYYYFNGVAYKKISYAKKLTFDQLKKYNLQVSMNDIIDLGTATKLEAIKEQKIDLMIDDSPIVIQECLDNKIDCVMVSTDKTPYNHYLRNKVLWGNNLFQIAKIKSL